MSTGRLNQAVKRNAERFPEDFMFCLSPPEHAALKSQIAMSKPGRRGRRKVYEAIRALMDTPAPKRRGIGFTADLEEK